MRKWTETHFQEFFKSKSNNSFNNNWVTPIFELDLHLFMIHLSTKYHLNQSNHQWENERKLIFKKFTKSKGNNFFNDNRSAPIFNLYLHLFMIHLYIKYHLNSSNHHWENERKLSLSWVWRTDGEQDGHRHTIIRPVFNGRIKIVPQLVLQKVQNY
jgi:hypothetical protein